MPTNNIHYDRTLSLVEQTEHGDAIELLAGTMGIRIWYGSFIPEGLIMPQKMEYLEFRDYPELEGMFDPDTGWNMREVRDFIRGINQDQQRIFEEIDVEKVMAWMKLPPRLRTLTMEHSRKQAKASV